MIIGIYESLDDHRAITALDLTSRKLYNIWRLKTATIIKAVLPRATDRFDLAQELVIVQGRSTGVQTGTHEAVLQRSKKLLNNAAVAFRDYNSSSLRVSNFGDHRPSPDH